MGRGGGGDAHGVPERVVDADLGGHAHEGCERRGPVRPGSEETGCGEIAYQRGAQHQREIAYQRGAIGAACRRCVGLLRWYRELGAWALRDSFNQEAKPARADPRRMDWHRIWESSRRRRGAAEPWCARR